MSLSDEVLMAYVDDELDAQGRIEVEAAMAADSDVARRVGEHRALRARVRSAFDPVLDEPVPARLLDVVRTAPATATAPAQARVVPRTARDVRTRSLPRWAALAASVLVGILAGRFAFHGGGPGVIATRNGQMMASGVLADALTSQLAVQQRVGQPVHIGVSFRAKSGEYCRTFSMRAPAVTGLACHAAKGWRLQVLSGAGRVAADAGNYRQAASSLPPAVVAAVTDEISSDPLDARAERLARNRGWQP